MMTSSDAWVALIWPTHTLGPGKLFGLPCFRAQIQPCFYLFVCVCVCVCVNALSSPPIPFHQRGYLQSGVFVCVRYTLTLFFSLSFYHSLTLFLSLSFSTPSLSFSPSLSLTLFSILASSLVCLLLLSLSIITFCLV